MVNKKFEGHSISFGEERARACGNRRFQNGNWTSAIWIRDSMGKGGIGKPGGGEGKTRERSGMSRGGLLFRKSRSLYT